MLEYPMVDNPWWAIWIQDTPTHVSGNPRIMNFRELKSCKLWSLFGICRRCLIPGLCNIPYPTHDWHRLRILYYNYFAIMAGQYVSKFAVICSICLAVLVAQVSKHDANWFRGKKINFCWKKLKNPPGNSRNLDLPNTNWPIQWPSLQLPCLFIFCSPIKTSIICSVIHRILSPCCTPFPSNIKLLSNRRFLIYSPIKGLGSNLCD